MFGRATIALGIGPHSSNVLLCGVLLKTTSNIFGCVLLTIFKINRTKSITHRCNYCGVPHWVCKQFLSPLLRSGITSHSTSCCPTT